MIAERIRPLFVAHYDSPTVFKSLYPLVQIFGNMLCAHLQQEGGRLQIYVKLDFVGEKGFALYKLLDLGDIIGVKGYLFRTRTNELSAVLAYDLSLVDFEALQEAGPASGSSTGGATAAPAAGQASGSAATTSRQ